MAVNQTRSMNADLREGLTDGTVKKVAPNRGGSSTDEDAALRVYAELSDELYDPSFSDVATQQVARRLTQL